MALTMEKQQKFPYESIPLLICPYCRKSILRLILKPLNANMNISVSCSCLNGQAIVSLRDFIYTLINSFHQLAQAKERPLSLTKNNNTVEALFDREVKIECSFHSEPYSHYCPKCSINICFKCVEKHNSHQLATLGICYKEREVTFFPKRKKKNRDLTRKLIERIDAQIASLTTMKANIQSACEANEIINKDLEQLYQSLVNIGSAFEKHPSIDLMRLQTIAINTEEYNEEQRSIEEEYVKLMEHLRLNYILKQKMTNECSATLTGHKRSVNCLIELNDGRLASSSNDRTIKLWNLSTNQCESTLTKHAQSSPFFARLINGRLPSDFSDDAPSKSNFLHIINSLDDNSNLEHSLIRLKDGRFSSCTNAETIKLWNWNTDQSQTLAGHKGKVNCLLQLNDGRLASGSYDRTVKLWDLSVNECVATFWGHNDSVYCVIQLKDGRIASGSLDCTIKLWHLSGSNQFIATLTGHSDSIYCLIQLNDGSLASGGYDSCIKLWNSDTYECIATLTGHNYCVNCLIQLSDGRLASGAVDKTIKLWEV